MQCIPWNHWILRLYMARLYISSPSAQLDAMRPSHVRDVVVDKPGVEWFAFLIPNGGTFAKNGGVSDSSVGTAHCSVIGLAVVLGANCGLGFLVDCFAEFEDLCIRANGRRHEKWTIIRTLARSIDAW